MLLLLTSKYTIGVPCTCCIQRTTLPHTQKWFHKHNESVTKWERKARKLLMVFFLILYRYRNTFSGLNLVKWILGKENVLMTPNLTASLLWSVSPCLFFFPFTQRVQAALNSCPWKTKKFCNLCLVLVCSVSVHASKGLFVTTLILWNIVEFKYFLSVFENLLSFVRVAAPKEKASLIMGDDFKYHALIVH